MNDSKKEKLKDEPRPQPDIEWTEMTRALAQVVLGNLMVVLGVGSLSYYCMLCYVSAGIWVGATVQATGLLGVIEASRSSWYSRLQKSYIIMLIITTILSMALFGVEVAGYVYDSEGCDKPFRNMTSTAPPSMSPSPPQYTTHPSWGPDCRMECVYIHAGLGTFGLLQFAAAVICIYYTSQSVMKVMKVAPLPYKAMMPEPIPYKA